MPDDYYGYNSASNERLKQLRFYERHMGENLTEYSTDNVGSDNLQGYERTYKPAGDPGKNDGLSREGSGVEAIHQRIWGQNAESVRQLIGYWTSIASMLQGIAQDLKAKTDALGPHWVSPGATMFKTLGPGPTLKSLEDWRLGAYETAQALQTLYGELNQRQTEITALLEEYFADFDSTAAMLQKEVASAEGKPSVTVDTMSAEHRQGYIKAMAGLQSEYTYRAQQIESALASAYWDAYSFTTRATPGIFEGPTNAVVAPMALDVTNPNVPGAPGAPGAVPPGLAGGPKVAAKPPAPAPPPKPVNPGAKPGAPVAPLDPVAPNPPTTPTPGAGPVTPVAPVVPPVPTNPGTITPGKPTPSVTAPVAPAVMPPAIPVAPGLVKAALVNPAKPVAPTPPSAPAPPKALGKGGVLKPGGANQPNPPAMPGRVAPRKPNGLLGGAKPGQPNPPAMPGGGRRPNQPNLPGMPGQRRPNVPGGPGGLPARGAPGAARPGTPGLPPSPFAGRRPQTPGVLDGRVTPPGTPGGRAGTPGQLPPGATRPILDRPQPGQPSMPGQQRPRTPNPAKRLPGGIGDPLGLTRLTKPAKPILNQPLAAKAGPSSSVGAHKALRGVQGPAHQPGTGERPPVQVDLVARRHGVDAIAVNPDVVDQPIADAAVEHRPIRDEDVFAPETPGGGVLVKGTNDRSYRAEERATLPGAG